MANHKVADLKLADAGRLRIDWAETRMPVLMALREKGKKDQPLKGMKVAGCLHVTKETAVLIRTIIAQAAVTHDIMPRSISFKGALQTLEAFQPVMEMHAAADRAGSIQLLHILLDAIATHRVADRPDRFEPRLKKRREVYYDWLTKPRAEIKSKMAKGVM